MISVNKLGALAPAIAAIMLAAFTGAAAAQVTAEQQSAIRGNCRSDFMSKCSGVTPGGKEALQCLQKNVAGLSPGCKTAVSATIPAPAPAAAAPPPPPKQAAPVAPPPAPAAPPPAAATASPPPATAPAAAPPAVRQVPPHPAQIAKPAAPKQAAVAAPPPAAAPPPPVPTTEQMAAIKFTCRREFANNCRGVPAGGSEAIDCLQRNAGKLTPDCKTSLAALGDARPASAGTPNAPIVMTAVIGRACMRDLLLHCRDAKLGDGRKIACLLERGPALAPLCKAALKITEPVR